MNTRNEVQAVIYREKERTREILVLTRFNGEAGIDQYRFVKGGIEKDEREEDALVREVGEETGITEFDTMTHVRSYSFTVDDLTHHVAVFLVRVPENTIATPDSTHEGSSIIREAQWYSPEEAEQLLTFKEEKDSLAFVTNAKS